jgi:SAM-dependent methyltransferase
MFRGAYRPIHSQNRMRDEGNIDLARESFFRRAPQNLKLLLRRRFEWMNDFIGPDDIGVEVGSGTGLSRNFIRAKALYLTDVADYSWLDYKHVDALDTPFADAQFDFVVSSNMVHHVARPLMFFREMERILKPGGKLIIQEINSSLVMRLLLRAMRHEGYSYDVNVFDEHVICNDPLNPWSANCAIPNLLWDDTARFERHVPMFSIVHQQYGECTTLINSGGVIAKTLYVPLPALAVRIMQGIDAALVAIAPSVFALQRQIVLQKRPLPALATSSSASASSQQRTRPKMKIFKRADTVAKSAA